MFKQLEKQTYLIYFKDGIFELLFGSIFIIFAINTWFDREELVSPYWLRLLIIPVSIVLALIKEFVTKKRIGKVSFSKMRRQKSKWMYIVLILAQIIILIAFLLASTGNLGADQKTSLVGLLIEFMILVLIFYSVTWFTGYNTFLFAGLVFAFCTPFLLLINPELHHSNIRIGLMLTAGFSFCIFGVIRFSQFLKKYPKTKSNE
jgi:hypothetical protein